MKKNIKPKKPCSTNFLNMILSNPNYKGLLTDGLSML